MSNRVTAIEITFENIESIVIPAEYFGWFALTEIEDEIRRAAINAILKSSVANCVEFELLRRTEEDALKFENYMLSIVDSTWSLFDRIRESNDITHITAIFDDGTNTDYEVYWENDGVNQCCNRCQHAEATESGGLLVRIVRGAGTLQ